MGWLGKIVGGGIGFVLGGPLGAVLGAALGHGYDTQKEGWDAGKTFFRIESREENPQAVFFVAAFSMIAKLTKADGRITEEEIASIEHVMAKDLHLDIESRKMAIRIFRAASQSGESFESFAMQFAKTFRYEREILEMMVDILYRVAISDGAMTGAEERLIRNAVRFFSLPSGFYDRIQARYARKSTKGYEVLGVDPSVSDDELKKQYRKLVRENHPDAIASKGLPEEFTILAQEKFREIHEAYENIKKIRGMK